MCFGICAYAALFFSTACSVPSEYETVDPHFGGTLTERELSSLTPEQMARWRAHLLSLYAIVFDPAMAEEFASSPEEKRFASAMLLIELDRFDEARKLLEPLKENPAFTVGILELAGWKTIAPALRFEFGKPEPVYVDRSWRTTVRLGNVPVSFLLDTGAPYSHLTRETAQKSGIRDPGAGRVILNRFSFGGVTVFDAGFAVGEGDYNVIGLDILRHLHVKIRRSRKSACYPFCYEFSRPQEAPAGKTVSPLLEYRNRVLIRMVPGNGQRFWAMLDTGASETKAHPAYFRRSGGFPETVRYGHVVSHTFYGTNRKNMLMIPEVSLRFGGSSVRMKDVFCDHALKYYFRPGMDIIGDETEGFEFDVKHRWFRFLGDPPEIRRKERVPLFAADPNPCIRCSSRILGDVTTIVFSPLTALLESFPFAATENAMEWGYAPGALAGYVPAWLLTNWFYPDRIPLKELFEKEDRDMLKNLPESKPLSSPAIKKPHLM